MFFLTFIERKDAFIVSETLPSLTLTEKCSKDLVFKGRQDHTSISNIQEMLHERRQGKRN
jgi:hypothetical protein